MPPLAHATRDGLRAPRAMARPCRRPKGIGMRDRGKGEGRREKGEGRRDKAAVKGEGQGERRSKKRKPGRPPFLDGSGPVRSSLCPSGRFVFRT